MMKYSSNVSSLAPANISVAMHQLNPGEFVVLLYDFKNTGLLATIILEHQHLMHYCLFRFYPEAL